jgi:hypothetical protein
MRLLDELDDEALDELIEELIDVQRVAPARGERARIIEDQGGDPLMLSLSKHGWGFSTGS